MQRFVRITSLGFLALLAGACGKDKGSSGAGTFPNFGTLALSAAPSFASTLLTTSRTFSTLAGADVGIFTFPSTSYSTTAGDWTSATTTNSDLIATVLLDGGISGTVKSMFVVIAQAQSRMADINTNFSDSSGNPTNCTVVSSSVTPTVPFFATATNAAFNTWSDAGAYTCYTTTASNGIIAFGRQAISSPASGCTDAFRYYVLEGSSQDDATNTEEVATRGTMVDSSSMSRYYYDGCTKDLNVIYAQTTMYSAGLEFSSRTELTGNSNAHTFSMRIGYIDANGASGGSFTSFLGTGQSMPATSGSTSNFVIGYDRQNCTGSASSSYSCSSSSQKEFCAKNAGTSTSSSELDTTVANCSTLNSTYTGLTALANSDLPHTYFAVSASSMGF